MATKQGMMDRLTAWNAGRLRKQQEQRKAAYATVASGVKDAFTVFCGGFLPFAILVILSISAGYYFNSLRGFSGDTQSLVAYGTAAIVECGNLALFFVSAKAFWSGKTAHFVLALLLGLGLTLISVIAQVLYLSNNLDAASIGKGASLLHGLPLLGSLASTATIIVTRALALHVVEFACCYVIARSSVSHRKVMQAMIDEQSEQMLLQLGQQYIAFLQSRMAATALEPKATARPALPPNHITAEFKAIPDDHLKQESEGAKSNGQSTF